MGPRTIAATAQYSGATGRVNLLDADSSGTLYAGSDGGGVWKSTDAGGSWTPLSDTIPAPKVTALRVDPQDARVLFAGLNTGELDVGAGLYRSADAGATWTQVGSALFGTNFVTAIQVDPTNDSYVYVGLRSGGVALSTDNGLTWTLSIGTEPISDLAVAANGDLFAVVMGAALIKTTDHGRSWTSVVYPLYNAQKVAIAPSNNAVMYIEAADAAFLTAIWRSLDAGKSWVNICDAASRVCGWDGGANGAHGTYDYIAVDRGNPDIVFLGVVDLWETANGTSASPAWTDLQTAANSSGKSVHADQHGFAQTSAGYFYANDGGVYRSNDGGRSFLFSGNGLGTLQFYSGSIGSLGSQVVIGGLQDNGVLVANGGQTWQQVLGGDGFSAIVDPQNDQNMFADINDGLTYYSSDGGAHWNASAGPDPATDVAYLLAPLVIKPGSSTTLYLGVGHLWRSTDAARHFQQQGAPPQLASSFRYLAADASGQIFGSDGSQNALSFDEGNTWQVPVRAPCTSCYITDVAVASGTLYETAIDNGGPRGHVYRSIDHGASWNQIDAGLPAAAIHSITALPTTPTTIYVGTSTGVFVSHDQGGTWQDVGFGLPDTAVMHLAVRSDGSSITAFTFGRGAWSLAMPTAVPDQPTEVAALAGEASATVYWSAPASSGTSPFTGFTVTSSPGNLSVSVGPTARSATVGGLVDGTAYTFTVTASNASGPGPPSAPSNSVTPGRGQYHPLSPARILDTRGTIGGHHSQLGPDAYLSARITGQGGVPATGVAAVVINVTATNTSNASYLTVWPTGLPRPNASNLNWTAGKTVPNLVEVAVGAGGMVSAYNAAGSTDVIFDVAGYVSTPVEPPGSDGLYTPVVPKRVLDTRDGTGGVRAGAVGPNGTVNLQVNGQAGLPATGVAAVVLNVTVTAPSQPSFLTVFPTGTTRPEASNLNFVPGQTVPNRVIVKVGSNGTPGWVSFYNAAGSTHVIADIAGWYSDGSNAAATGSRFVGLVPARILDTRDGTGGFSSPLGPGQTIAATVAGLGGVPAMSSSIPPRAVVLNLTVTGTTGASYLTVWPSDASQPAASDLNWVPGLTVPNLVVVKVGGDGKVKLYNAAGSVNVIADVVGWYG